MSETIFQTKDISLAAYMLVKDYKIVDVTEVNWVCFFGFKQSKEVEKETLNYFNNEWGYLDFANRLKDLKTLIHNR